MLHLSLAQLKVAGITTETFAVQNQHLGHIYNIILDVMSTSGTGVQIKVMGITTETSAVQDQHLAQCAVMAARR